MEDQQGNSLDGGMPVLEPGVIKVFGVIHLVFAGLGVVMLIFSVLSLVFQKAMTGLMGAGMTAGGSTGGGDETLDRLQELMGTLQKEMMIPTVLGLAFTAILAVLLFIAGIGLLKKRRNAVAASNRYAVASIAFKVIGVILFFTITKAAQERYFEGYAKFLEETGMAAASGTAQIMNISGAISGVLSPVVMMIYPIVALVMLNRPQVKEFLARKGA